MHALIVHSFDQARAALRVAQELSKPILLLTAPGDAARMGVDVLRSMVDQAAAEVGDAAFEAVIDCGGEPGTAMAALRAGWRDLVFAGDAVVTAKIMDLAHQHGARLRAGPPPARDLGDSRDPERALRAWLCT